MRLIFSNTYKNLTRRQKHFSFSKILLKDKHYLVFNIYSKIKGTTLVRVTQSDISVRKQTFAIFAIILLAFTRKLTLETPKKNQ